MLMLLLAALSVVPQIRSLKISDRELPDEGYRIRVDSDGKVQVRAKGAAGRFYAFKTLGQLGAVKGPLEIEDWPEYRWRGVHLDESRHFFGKEAVKKLIRTMAENKLNILHWHLVDDCGWRIAVPGYPKTATVGATRGATKGRGWLRDVESGTYGPFCYTTEDLKEVLKEATENFVRIVPEIEVPGHATHLLHNCYPQFSCNPEKPGDAFCLGNDEGIRFLTAAVDYVADVFPGEFVHIGGDEVKREVWTSCPKCQARARALGLKGTDLLQNWVTRRFAERLAKKGKRIIGWEEIMDGGLPDGAAVMSWRGGESGVKAVQAGHDVVMCPCFSCYFDYVQCVKDDPVPCQPFVPPVPVSTVYAFDPATGIPCDRRQYVLGGQCCNWSEWTCTPAELEWKLWPRACALAEALWTAPENRDYEEFAKRLSRQRDRMIAAGVNVAPVTPRDGVYLTPRPRRLELTLGTLDVRTNVVSEAICAFHADKTVNPGEYRMSIRYSKGISIWHADEKGKQRALATLKALARPDGRQLDCLSFSSMEIED